VRKRRRQRGRKKGKNGGPGGEEKGRLVCGMCEAWYVCVPHSIPLECSLA